jgi:hypothetical protein
VKTEKHTIGKNLAWFFVVALASVLYFWGAYRQDTLVNTDMHEIDQSAYLDYAKNMALTNLTYAGDRNRMPLYPALMSFFYREGMSDDAFFERGKQVGIVIGYVGLVVAFLLFTQVSQPGDALIGALVAMLTVFVYKAPYFQAEVLFYAINLLLFYLLLTLVKQPKLSTAALAGCVGGIGHLIKASVLPGILLAALLVLCRSAYDLWQQHHSPSKPVIPNKPSRYELKIVGVVVLLLGCFHLVIYPYIRDSKERFGRYYYNVNSTFYMWYDSWAEAEQGTKAHGDRQGWPDMPPEDIPSFQKYVSEHTFSDAIHRIIAGFSEMKDRVFQSYGYATFVLVYASALTLLYIQNKRTWLPGFMIRLHPCVLLFMIGYFLGYSLLYAWYSPIAAGNRFILSLFLPLLLLFVWLLSYARRHQFCFAVFGNKIPASSINLALLLYLLAYTLVIFPSRIAMMFGGS